MVFFFFNQMVKTVITIVHDTSQDYGTLFREDCLTDLPEWINYISILIVHFVMRRQKHSHSLAVIKADLFVQTYFHLICPVMRNTLMLGITVFIILTYSSKVYWHIH